jgi:cell division inhibitor SepF
MALRDSWHRALVYFGLAEENEYGPEYEEEFAEEEEIEARREPGQVRRLPTSRRARRDEIDDIFADDEPISASRTRTSSSRATSTTPSRSPTSSSARCR